MTHRQPIRLPGRLLQRINDVVSGVQPGTGPMQYEQKFTKPRCCSTMHTLTCKNMMFLCPNTNGSPKVSDYQAHPGMQPGMQGPGMPGQQMMLPGQILAQQAMMQQVLIRGQMAPIYGEVTIHTNHILNIVILITC